MPNCNDLLLLKKNNSEKQKTKTKVGGKQNKNKLRNKLKQKLELWKLKFIFACEKILRKNLEKIEKNKQEIMSNAHNVVLDHLNSKNVYGYEDQKTLLFGK